MTANSARPRVIVIGAGATGLFAAHQLASHGLRVEILEARDRLGGRILTIQQPQLAYAIELGAEFVQGTSPILLELAAAASLPIVEMQGIRWRARAGRLEPHPICGPDLDAAANQFVAARHADASLQEFLEVSLPGDAQALERGIAASRIQDYDAAYPDRISIDALVRQWHAEAGINGDRTFRVVGGYGRLVQSIGEQLDPERVSIHLNTVVHEVRWQRNGVHMVAEAGAGEREFHAERAVITVPVGVLKASRTGPGALRFDPPLVDKRAALLHLEMGNVVKLVMCLKERIWDNAPNVPEPQAGQSISRVGFIHAHEEPFAAWWTANPFYAPVLTAWAAGPAADRLVGLSPQQLVDRAIDSAGRLFGIGRSRFEQMLVSWHHHDWAADPFSRGAYSYIGIGGLGAQAELARPVSETLFFAGEATDQHGHHAMVHGALAEGMRAASEVLASLGARGA